MKTLEEAWDLIETMNNDAHDESWNTWIDAEQLADSDDEADWEEAEETRERASLEQQEYFRDGYMNLSQEDQTVIRHWLERDDTLRDQFETYFGSEDFQEEFSDLDIER